MKDFDYAALRKEFVRSQRMNRFERALDRAAKRTADQRRAQTFIAGCVWWRRRRVWDDPLNVIDRMRPTECYALLNIGEDVNPPDVISTDGEEEIIKRETL